MSIISSAASSILSSGTSTPRTTPISGSLVSTTATSIISYDDFKPPSTLIPRKWMGDDVRSINIREVREAAISLSQAFASDDLAQYLIPQDIDDVSKWNLHVDIMTYIVAAHCYSGLVTTSGIDYEGVALWMPPGKMMDDWWTVMRSGMWRLYYQLNSEGRRRYYDELLPLLHRTKTEVMGDRDNDCYYLVYIGTKPRCRGQGYGKRLIEDMCEKADAENRPVYLESSNIMNNSYYRKFGFEVRREIYLNRGSEPVQLTIMVREPHPFLPKEVFPLPLEAPQLSTSNSEKHRSLRYHHHFHLDPHALKKKLLGTKLGRIAQFHL